MTKLEELIKELCPNGVEHVELKEIGPVCMCKRILKSQTTSNGEVPFYKIGTFGGRANSFISHELYEEYKSKYNFPNKGDILISAAGTIGKLVIYNGEPAYFQDSNIVWIKNSEEKALNKYLYYCYETAPWVASTGGTIARLYNENIERAKIPLPPLAVQREIVRILDKFTLYSQELAAELAARRVQYEYYRDQLVSFNNKTEQIKWVLLQEILEIKNGSDYKRFGEGQYPVYGSGGVMTYIDNFIYDMPSVLIPRKGSLNNLFYVETPFWTVDTIFYTIIDTTKVVPKFVFYYLQNQHLEKLNKAGGVPSLTQSVLNLIKFPIPPLEVQERIVKVLDNFDAICSDLGIGLPAEIEKRQQQYEFYRDKLLTFGTGLATIFTDRQTDRAD